MMTLRMVCSSVVGMVLALGCSEADHMLATGQDALDNGGAAHPAAAAGSAGVAEQAGSASVGGSAGGPGEAVDPNTVDPGTQNHAGGATGGGGSYLGSGGWPISTGGNGSAGTPAAPVDTCIGTGPLIQCPQLEFSASLALSYEELGSLELRMCLDESCVTGSMAQLSKEPDETVGAEFVVPREDADPQVRVSMAGAVSGAHPLSLSWQQARFATQDGDRKQLRVELSYPDGSTAFDYDEPVEFVAHPLNWGGECPASCTYATVELGEPSE